MPSAKKKPGLYANIHAKQERIAHGSGEKMRRPGSPGAPTAAAFEQAAEKKPAGKKPTAKKTAAKTTAKKTAAKKAAVKRAPVKKRPSAKKSGASTKKTAG
jgi:topoisomerase IA-like protein